MSKAFKVIQQARINKNNEFYTTFEHMEYLFRNEEIKQALKDKIIYLPCDTENSMIYKYLAANKKSLQIKDILRTSDDYYQHLDLYQKCDIVFTNPPFTGLRKYVTWLDEDLNKKFILFSSWGSFVLWDKFWDKLLLTKRYRLLSDRKFEYIPYDTISGDKAIVSAFVFTNIESFTNIRRHRERDIKNQKDLNIYLKEKPDKVYYRNNDNVLYVQNSLYIPKDYKGEISVQQMTYMTYEKDLIYVRKDNNDLYRYIVKIKDQDND